MQRHVMKSKIHRATITSADLNYEGSLTGVIRISYGVFDEHAVETYVPRARFVDRQNRIVRPQLRAAS